MTLCWICSEICKCGMPLDTVAFVSESYLQVKVLQRCERAES